MKTKDKELILTIRNVTPDQYKWVQDRARKLSINLTAVIKIMIQTELEKRVEK